MDHDPTTHDAPQNGSPLTSTEPTLTPLTLDPDKYRHHLDEFDLTDEQKTQLLQTLWSIMSTMVDIGFSVDSVQLASLFARENSGPESGDALEQTDNEKSFAREKNDE